MLTRWFKTSLEAKFFTVVLAVIVVSAVASALIIGFVELKLMRDALITRGQSFASYVAELSQDAIIARDSISLDNIVKKINDDPDVCYTEISDVNGRVLTSFFSSLDLTSVDVKKALAETPVNSGLTTVIDRIKKDGLIREITAPIMINGELIGQVAIGISQDTVRKGIARTIAWIFLAYVISLVIALLLLDRIKGLVIEPIMSLSRLMEEVSRRKDYSVRAVSIAQDELGVLVQGFNDMLEQIEKDEREIESNRRYFEEELARRTKELIQVNGELGIEKEGLEKAYRELSSERRVVFRMREALQAADKEIKAAQAQLLQAEKMASLGQLAAGVAHEINNPMGYILSNLHTLEVYLQKIKTLIKAYGELEERLNLKQQEYGLQAYNVDLDYVRALKEKINSEHILADIQQLMTQTNEGAHRVRKIVADLKTFAHIDRDEPQEADINQLIDLAFNIVWNEVKYKAEVVKDYANLPLVRCYPQKLHQVFMNLLINAVQSIEGRGKIIVKTYVQGEDVLVAIEDTGCGIPQEIQRRIFDPFFTTKEVGVGTGLGLSIAYSIIRKHRGDISVSSEPGQGAVFTVRIPIGGPDIT
ncbi:MAG: HAMP domain-containing protein [Candidatus Omnitrophica bacterium]|nr:HAMP domain-containing protein [Candidatus Omnitrophota bacterium]